MTRKMRREPTLTGHVEKSVEHVHSASQNGNSVSEVPNGDAFSSDRGEACVCVCCRWVCHLCDQMCARVGAKCVCVCTRMVAGSGMRTLELALQVLEIDDALSVRHVKVLRHVDSLKVVQILLLFLEGRG